MSRCGGLTQMCNDVSSIPGSVGVAEASVLEQKCLRVPESRRIASHVDQHVVLHGAVGTADQFGFAASRSSVQAADELRRTGVSALARTKPRWRAD